MPFQTDRFTLSFNTLYDALLAVFSVRNRPLLLSPLQHTAVGQAVLRSGAPFTFADVDFHGRMRRDIAAGEYDIVTSDYAGIMPDIPGDIELWREGAGFLDLPPRAPIRVVDLTVLNPGAPAGGAVVWCDDEKLHDELKRFATLGVEKAAAWNERVESLGNDALMPPLLMAYWRRRLNAFAASARHRTALAERHNSLLASCRLIDRIPSIAPRVYPLRLAPELYCPKEDIYEALHRCGIAATVPYKPLYAQKAFASAPLPGAGDFYKAVIALPLYGLVPEEIDAHAQNVLQIFDRYAYRGCTF